MSQISQTLQALGKQAIHKPWGGLTAAQAHTLYKELYALGTLSSAHFGVELEPLFADGAIGKSASLIDWFNPSIHLPWLAQSVDAHILDAQSDSVNVGHYQLNHLSGNGSGELQVAFLETRRAQILKSTQIIKNLMFNANGTQNPPKDYLMRLKVYAFDRQDRENHVFEQQHIVALTDAAASFEVGNSGTPALVQVTFTKMFPMLKSV